MLDDKLDQVGHRSSRRGRGTAGQLLHDQQLYENMNRAASELRDLLADIRKDPKKYLGQRQHFLSGEVARHGEQRQFGG